ncbi:DUF1905 domain-containing protein [Kribbella sp. CA-245084]|uniref:DUF1905 domain-containing protein n=1 Tax=Kribbella sp. CA-245084 TaxID=3239940 RepID=UPI003D92209C
MSTTIEFTGTVRYWDPAKGSGLAVIDVPADCVQQLGGRKQRRVVGTLNGADFAGSTMLVAGGGFCVGASKAALKAAQAGLGDEVRVVLEGEQA